jgi:hypothetical protein
MTKGHRNGKINKEKAVEVQEFWMFQRDIQELTMKQSPREANSHSASQEIPCLIWNPKIHHRSSRGFLGCGAV